MKTVCTRLFLFVVLLTSACSADATGAPTPTPTGDWQAHSPMLAARSEMAAAVLEDRIYVPGGFGGERMLEAYDPAADRWQSLARLPEGRHHLMAAAQAGRVYVFGGAPSAQDWTPQADAWVYDPGEDAWSALPSLPEPRLAGAAVSMGDLIYIAGGVGGSGALLRFDPQAQTWETLAAPRQPREHNAAAALDGKLYLLGGRWQGTGELASVEVYDPATGVWSEGPALATARAGFAAAVLDGRIIVVGGEVLSGPAQALSSVEIFDPQQGGWLPGPALPVALHGGPPATAAGRLYVLGGSDRAGAVENRGRVLSLPAAALAGSGAGPAESTPDLTDATPQAAGEADGAVSDPGTPPPLLTPPGSAGPTAPAPGEPAAGWVETTLAQLSLEQQVGQLLLTGLDEAEANEEVCRFIAEIQPGGIIYQRGNLSYPHQARELSLSLQRCAEAGPGIPLFIAIDHEGEYVIRFNEGATTFPAALAQGAAGDPALAGQIALAAGQELAYSGINLVLGPVADVLLNSDNEVVSQRTFGGDPQAVSRFVEAAVQGYRQAGLVPALKHFPGHGGVAGDSHKLLPVDGVDRAGLESGYLPPFRSGLAAGAPVVMLAHVAYPAVTGSESPATLSPEMVRLLRDEAGFQGVILSDSMNMRGVTGGTIPVEEASLAAVQAGVDQLLISSPDYVRRTHERLLAAVQSGELPVERLAASVRRILALKAASGLSSFPVAVASEPDWEANARLAFEAGRRAVTVFRDEGALLPVPEATVNILVVGPEADWSLYEALAAALEARGKRVTFSLFPSPWVEIVEPGDLLESLPVLAGQHDLVVLFTWQVHLDRLLTGATFQADLAQRLVEASRPVIAIGIKSPTDLLDLPPGVSFLAMYGSTAGQQQGVLDALTGAGTPPGQNPLPGLP